MNWKAWAPLVIAIVLGLFAARVAMNIVGNNPTVVAKQETLTPIVVAARDIDPGTTLTAADVKTMRVDSTALPSGAVLTPNEIEGRVLRFATVVGQPILSSTLADPSAGAGQGAIIPAGFRLVTLEINNVSGVAGFIQPQSRIDVVATVQQEGKPTAVTVLEGVKVWAVGSRTNPNPAPLQPGQPPEQPANNVTLLVEPEQAEKIELATSTSRVRLLIRNGTDTKHIAKTGTQLADVIGRSGTDSDPFASDKTNRLTAYGKSPTTNPSTASSGAPTQPWEVEVIKMGQRTTQQFNTDGKSTTPAGKTDGLQTKPSTVSTDTPPNF